MYEMQLNVALFDTLYYYRAIHNFIIHLHVVC